MRTAVVEAHMFTCKESVHVLVDFLDGELSEEDAKQLQSHLSACPPCVDFLRTYRATPGLCKRALLVKKMPGEMADKLNAYLRAKIQGKR